MAKIAPMRPSPTSATRCWKPVRGVLLAPERPRSSSITDNLVPAQLLGSRRQVVLTPPAFVVMADLANGGLTHIHYRRTRKMLRSNLRSTRHHRRLPPRRRRVAVAVVPVPREAEAGSPPAALPNRFAPPTPTRAVGLSNSRSRALVPSSPASSTEVVSVQIVEERLTIGNASRAVATSSRADSETSGNSVS